MEIKTAPRKTLARVLIVDDHPNTALTLARAMTQTNPRLEVITAQSGEAALELVRDRTVDVLITDMVMPGMNGLELIEKLQLHPGGKPAYVMLITAYDVPGLKISAQRLKVNEVVLKPVRPERICQGVMRALEEIDAQQHAESPAEKAKAKILVADDLQDNVTLLARYLENEGYICLTAANGVEALERIRAEMPDLVLLDMNMPVKDGFETLQEIRSDAALRHIPVIILTAARLEPMDMQVALNMGADDYITKPFDRREMLARIRTRLRVKEAEDIIRQRNRELNLLPEIGRELSARLDVGELMDIILRRATETLGALAAHILLITPQGQLYKTYEFSVGLREKSGKEIPDWSALIKPIKESRQGLILNDVYVDTRWPVIENDPTRSAVVAPMFGRYEMLGLLCLVHEQPHYFSSEQRLLLQALAGQAAIAFENAILYARVEQERQQLEAVLQSAEDAIVMFDTDFQVSLINQAGKALFPTPAQKTDMGWHALILLLEQARQANAIQTQTICLPDGRKFAARVVPVDGGYVASLHNIL